MLPTIALLGRPNVGKSTLFNYLTKSRDAIVADFPGLTRDRQYGFGKRGPRPFIVIDTGGLIGGASGLDSQVSEQAWRALDDADVVLFMVDGREGMNASDQRIASELRQKHGSIQLVVNKTEGQQRDTAVVDFHGLGLGQPWAVSATHGHGVDALVEEVMRDLPISADAAPDDQETGIRVAVIGRPNAGKSTLINRILGEERLVASEKAGTTRDSVFVPFERDGQKYTLIDTAGVRRRRSIDEDIEKFSVAKTLQAIDQAHVVVPILDAQTEIAEQDARLIGLAIERGRAMVLAINKWDGLEPDEREKVENELEIKLPFTSFAEQHFISALHGSGVGNLFGAINSAYDAAMAELPTPDVTRLLESALQAHQPPTVGGRRIKLRYAHQGGKNPPLIVIHGSQTEKLPDTYRRYLINHFRKAFKLMGTPLRLELKSTKNPYEGRKSTQKLTARQEKKRHRQRRHLRKKARK